MRNKDFQPETVDEQLGDGNQSEQQQTKQETKQEEKQETKQQTNRRQPVNRRRNIRFHIAATEEEAAQIRQRMSEIGVTDMGAYARKMMIDGLHVTVDLTCVKEMVSLLRRIGLNVNQIAKRANETRSVYASDIEDLRLGYDDIWQAARKILEGLSKIR